MIKNRTFLISGTTKGIGLSITKKILKKGGKVIGISRTKNNPKINSKLYQHVTLDLFKSDIIESSISTILQEKPEIDGLISNAGFGNFKSLEEFSVQEIKNILNLNLLSHILLSRVVVPHLKKKRKGDIIFIGSEASHLSGKKGTIYCASKFGLRGFSQSLRKECNIKNIKVTLINPGMVKTNFYDELNYKPKNSKFSVLKPNEIAKVVVNILNLKSNSVVDEINLTPMNKIIEKNQ